MARIITFVLWALVIGEGWSVEEYVLQSRAAPCSSSGMPEEDRGKPFFSRPILFLCGSFAVICRKLAKIHGLWVFARPKGLQDAEVQARIRPFA